MTTVRNNQYIARPCSGSPLAGNSQFHAYNLISPEGKDIGWMTQEECVMTAGGKEMVFETNTDSMCPKCLAHVESEYVRRRVK